MLNGDVVIIEVPITGVGLIKFCINIPGLSVGLTGDKANLIGDDVNPIRGDVVNSIRGDVVNPIRGDDMNPTGDDDDAKIEDGLIVTGEIDLFINVDGVSIIIGVIGANE